MKLNIVIIIWTETANYAQLFIIMSWPLRGSEVKYFKKRFFSLQLRQKSWQALIIENGFNNIPTPVM